jgi:hypothetical protein
MRLRRPLHERFEGVDVSPPPENRSRDEREAVLTGTLARSSEVDHDGPGV